MYELDEDPDWCYVVPADTGRAREPHHRCRSPPRAPPRPGAPTRCCSPRPCSRSYAVATGRGQEVVGHNNIGDVDVPLGRGRRQVRHSEAVVAVRWRDRPAASYHVGHRLGDREPLVAVEPDNVLKAVLGRGRGPPRPDHRRRGRPAPAAAAVRRHRLGRRRDHGPAGDGHRRRARAGPRPGRGTHGRARHLGLRRRSSTRCSVPARQSAPSTRSRRPSAPGCPRSLPGRSRSTS